MSKFLRKRSVINLLCIEYSVRPSLTFLTDFQFVPRKMWLFWTGRILDGLTDFLFITEGFYIQKVLQGIKKMMVCRGKWPLPYFPRSGKYGRDHFAPVISDLWQLVAVFIQITQTVSSQYSSITDFPSYL